MSVDREIIHDESHARALLFRFVREERERYLERFKGAKDLAQHTRLPKNKIKLHDVVCAIDREGLGDALVAEYTYTHPRRKRKKSYFVSFGGVQLHEEDYDPIKGDRKYPVVLTIFDSKLSVKDNVGSKVLLSISEHALSRMIVRNQCNSFSDIVHLIRINIEPFSRVLTRLPETDFVILTSDAYMPCTYDNDQLPLIKTWLSRPSWSVETEAKLWLACESLQRERKFAVLPAESFNTSKFIDENLIRKFMYDL